ncbi:MAG: undecaprenyl-diphosphate phosphatase, partial [Clostridia bacterium]|nr:undecaprenyl-diphosphate phosphatase [Clostridia bacterium]
LPVSSTGHLILLNYFLPLQDVNEHFADMFEFVVQLAAILAVIVVFWKRIFPFKLEKTSIQTEENNGSIEGEKSAKNKLVADMGILKLWLKVALACVPALLALIIDTLFDNLTPLWESLIIAGALILYGIVFIVVEKHNKKEPKWKEVSEISYQYAFFIGCFQLLAAVPGTSRSGVTIIGALLLGVSRTAATEFTFFLAIPTMVGASAYKLLKFFLAAGTMSGAEIGYLLIGSAVAFVVSLFAIKFLTNFVKKHDFKVFGWYRIALGIVVICALVLPPLLA